ncbi:MAG TPA: hypothetical protein VKS78_03885 [Roseiarcus sp.]|nr:hypothetical protein [Roseiarcus sp.]
MRIRLSSEGEDCSCIMAMIRARSGRPAERSTLAAQSAFPHSPAIIFDAVKMSNPTRPPTKVPLMRIFTGLADLQFEPIS